MSRAEEPEESDEEPDESDEESDEEPEAFRVLPFREELILKCLAKQLAQLPRELFKLIRSYVIIGWKYVIAFTCLNCRYHVKHVKYLELKLMGSTAKDVLIVLQKYILIYCIKNEHVKKHKAHRDDIDKLTMSNGGDLRYRTTLLCEYHSSDNFKRYEDLRRRAYEVKRQLNGLIYDDYLFVNELPRLESELTQEESMKGPYPKYGHIVGYGLF